MRTLILAVVVTLAGCQSDPLKAGRTLEPASFLSDRSDKNWAEACKLEMSGNVEGAKELYAEITRSNPQHGQAHHRLAVLLDRQGESELAAAYYDKALVREPDDAELLCDFGYNQYLLRHYKQAEGYLRRSLSLAPNLARAHNNLGLVMAHAGRPTEAMREFMIAGNNEAQAKINLAFAQMWQKHQGDFGGQDALTSGAQPTSLAGSETLAPPAATNVAPQFAMGSSNAWTPSWPNLFSSSTINYPE